MKKIVVIIFLIVYSTSSFSQEGNLFKPFFEQAMMLSDNNEYIAAEEQYRKAQKLLLYEFGLNDITNATYCHILYRRAHNLFLIDGMQDSSYACFKELYDLSKSPVDSISGEWFRTESVIMLSTIDLEKGRVRECCELLENEKQMMDNLNSDTRLQHKYFYYRNLARVYEYIVVNLLPGKEHEFNFLNSQYVIVRDRGFYKEYISVFKELVNLSVRYNKGDVKKLTEDYLLLASHCRVPEDGYTAEKTFENAFSMWNNIKDHDDMTYLRLCKGYLSFINRYGSSYGLGKSLDQKIEKEFDSIITSDSAVVSIIDLMDFYSVRLRDKTMDNPNKEVYVKRLCDKLELATANNFLILYYVCEEPAMDSLEVINNKKILTEYLSLCSIYYYDKENFSMGDLLLNKARFFSLLLPLGDVFLLEDLNNAVAKSAEIIGDEKLFYDYNSLNITGKLARGIDPSMKGWLVACNNVDNDTRIEKINDGINIFGKGKYDKRLLDFYLKLIESYFENNNDSMADENISIVDSILTLMETDGDKLPDRMISDLLLYKAKSALCKGDISNAEMFAIASNEKEGNIDAIEFISEIPSIDERLIDSIVYNQFCITKSFVQESYPFLSEKERIAFSQSRQFQWFLSIPRYSDKYPDDTLILSIAYNSALISKGTNLSVSSVIINSARGSEDKNVRKALDFYLQQTTIDVSDTSDRRRGNRKSFLEVLEKEMQRSLMVTSQDLEKYFCDWKSISFSLSENEMAIEFVEYVPFGNIGEDELYLGALYITKGGNPHIIRICKVTEIDSFKRHFEQNGLQWLSGIYDNIWQPILKENYNVNRLWFAPSIHLSQINIESALPDSIDAYRVSSTRNIITMNDTPDYSKIALFGGLNYDDKDTLKNDIMSNITAYNIIRGSNIDEERVGLTYLRGSLNEVVSAQKILSRVSQNIQMFVDRKGTEDRFKCLSGTGISLLHIATHGFYIKSDENVFNIGSRVMRKSGLFMSGVKAIWKGFAEKYSGDDGILLSEEIENLDFNKLNLVVLSACGTGLGNPTNDGVYGLQRAFKKAGAQTIIMSLWNVDDNATALMMETFYQELIKTNSKHRAFKNAQKTVREVFEDPYYWSAFIMLD